MQNACFVESLTGYLDRLASASSTPGGGSAATIVAAMAASLVAMVGRITSENPKYASKRENARSIVERADRRRAELLEAASRDEAAFDAVMASRGDERQRALVRAAQEPLDAMELELDVAKLAEEALALENPHLASDAGVACELAAAALRASAYNVRVNHRFLKDAAVVSRQAAQLQAIEDESASVLRRVREKAR